MDEGWDALVERGRAFAGAPPLSRAEKSKEGLSDPKWALGDLLLNEIPIVEIGTFAKAIGRPEGELRRLRDVAEKWPRDRRLAASWSAHRDLKDEPDRFDKIRPGMTVREAAQAAGKKPIDAKPLERMSLDDKANLALTLLGDKAVNDRFTEILRDRRSARRLERAANAAGDDRSAEYKNAMRNLRQAQTSKSPELAFLEVVFKIQQSAEYIRAVIAAATDLDTAVPLIPDHRKPELVFAIDAIADVADQALEALRRIPTSTTDVIDVEVATPRQQLREHASG